MEITYEQFQSWCKRNTEHIAQEISFKNLSNCSTVGGYECRFHFKILTKYGEGNISMFKSNGYFWADFEAADLIRFSKNRYYIKSIEFTDLSELDDYIKAFLKVLE